MCIYIYIYLHRDTHMLQAERPSPGGRAAEMRGGQGYVGCVLCYCMVLGYCVVLSLRYCVLLRAIVCRLCATIGVLCYCMVLS